MAVTVPPDDAADDGGAAVPPDRGGRRRRSRWLLIASLAGNLFLGGLLLGGLLGGRPPPPGGFDGFMALRQAATALPDDGAAVLRRAFVERHGDLGGRFRALQAVRRDVRDLLMADPFDAERAAAGLASLRGQTTDLQATVHETLVQAMAELTPEQRRILAERLASRHFGPPQSGPGRGGPFGFWRHRHD